MMRQHSCLFLKKWTWVPGQATNSDLSTFSVTCHFFQIFSIKNSTCQGQAAPRGNTCKHRPSHVGRENLRTPTQMRGFFYPQPEIALMESRTQNPMNATEATCPIQPGNSSRDFLCYSSVFGALSDKFLFQGHDARKCKPARQNLPVSELLTVRRDSEPSMCFCSLLNLGNSRAGRNSLSPMWRQRCPCPNHNVMPSIKLKVLNRYLLKKRKLCYAYHQAKQLVRASPAVWQIELPSLIFGKNIKNTPPTVWQKT